MAEQRDNDLSARIIAEVDREVSGRGVWESHWQESAELVWPIYSQAFTLGGADVTPGGGSKKTEKQFDSTGPNALVSFAAIMESLNTPGGSKWHRILPMDPLLMKNRAARLWYEDVTDALFRYRYSAQSGFQGQNQEVWMSMGAFGTGQIFVDTPDPKEGRGLRYRCIHLSEVYFRRNHQGRIDTAFRVFKLTARQAKQWFGLENLPEQITNCFKQGGNTEKEFEFIHKVCPREDVDPRRIDSKGMPFASYYVARTQKWMVKEGGYNSFPYPVARYWVGPGELYGRGPALLALPDIKVINEQEKTLLKQGHRAVDPVLLIHDDGMLDTLSLKPGAQNFGGVTADGRSLVHALPVGDIAVAKEMMAEKRASIEKVFLLKLFQILVENPRMTATEVVERAREKGMLLAPTAGRIQSEYLAPLIERELDLLAMQGLIPPMPQILREARAEYKTEYDSPMSRLQKAEEAAGTMRTIQWASEIAGVTQDPSVMDVFDFDVIIPDLAEANAMPVRHMASPEKIAAKRDSRAQAAQAQQASDVLPAVAGMAKAMQGSGG